MGVMARAEEPAKILLKVGSDPRHEGAPAMTLGLTGTVRTKFEWQAGDGKGRFDVRTARFGVGGDLYRDFSYKMEIDLSDEGKMKMVDAYAAARPGKGWTLQMGFMRVPFTTDAHRSPHLQYFANRSFIAKQAGNVRDVGATVGWSYKRLSLQAGVFNGSGLAEELKTYWTSEFNYALKGVVKLPADFTAQASYQTMQPASIRMHLYDASLTFARPDWIAEVEYLRKNYAHGAFAGVNSVDVFGGYGLPVRRGALRRVWFLGRYDYLADHSNGLFDTDGALVANDPRRHRATIGTTFSFGLPFAADIRINYEKYFYDSAAVAPVSERDKVVVEVMVHF